MLPKLVRDKIPEIIKRSGDIPTQRIVGGKELNVFLIRKMVEEVSEFEDSPCLEEAADIYEVFLALLDNWKLKLSDVKQIAKIKKQDHGGFQEHIVLEQVINGTNNN